MKREISKRIELSKGEAKVLHMKAKQCGLNETDLIRELIMGLQPTEAPPRQFYENMEIISQLGEAIQQFLKTWTGVATPEMVQILQGMSGQLNEVCVGIKKSVTQARFYSPDVYEIWEYEVQKAAKEGNIPPTLDEVRERYTRNAIMNPATDFDLGWNALGVQPPFLGEGAENPGDSPVVSPSEAPAAYPGDTQAGYTQEESDSISIEDYAATNIFSPPRKEGDY